MPVLKPKWEKFAQELAKGVTELEAYEFAGYSPHDSNASVLARKPEIIGRVSELIGEREQIHRQATAKAVEKVALTKEWILKNLIENVNRGLQFSVPMKDGKPIGDYRYEGNVVNRSLELLGKELGMFVDRKEVGDPGEFEKVKSLHGAELVDFLTRRSEARRLRGAPVAASGGTGEAGERPEVVRETGVGTDRQ